MSVMMIPITGLKTMQKKNDHSVPIFRLFPMNSEIIRESAYQITNMITTSASVMSINNNRLKEK